MPVEGRPALIAQDGPASGAVFELVSRRTTIGRDPENAIRLVGGGISRRHAEVSSEEGAHFVRDLGSANGTRVNGRPLQGAHRLENGDLVELGECRLLFVASLPVDALLRATDRAAAPRVPGEGGEAWGLLGESAAMARVRDLVGRLAPVKGCVLVTGETGTGKELVARGIHAAGPRAREPFIAVNCAALSEPLLLSELFGHEKGAFTGAHERRAGKFLAAGRGTIFLDEVGELTLGAQAALLRVLETGEVTRVGATGSVASEARVICATNRPLARMAEEGRFREDLLHRIHVLEVRLPPLRDRAGDVPLLVDRFLAEMAPLLGRVGARLSSAAREKLFGHSWPGNVRELRNAIERALVMAAGPEVGPNAIRLGAGPSVGGVEPGLETAPARLVASGDAAGTRRAGDTAPARTLEETERREIEAALARTGWNVKRAAEILGVPRRTFYSMLERLGIARP